MKKARIGMYWQVYGTQIVDLPDDINTYNQWDVIKWLQYNFDDIPLPVGDYVTGSDELDLESIEVYEDDVNE